MSARHSASIPTALLFLSGCAVPIPAHPPGHGPAAGPTVSTSNLARRPDAPRLVRLRHDRYRVEEPWTVELHGHRWSVQKGYVCNGITAPRNVRKVLGDHVNAPETWAAVFHDWLFTQPGVSRATADRLFYDLLLAYGVHSEKARLMHLSVASYSISKAIR